MRSNQIRAVLYVTAIVLLLSNICSCGVLEPYTDGYSRIYYSSLRDGYWGRWTSCEPGSSCYLIYGDIGGKSLTFTSPMLHPSMFSFRFRINTIADITSQPIGQWKSYTGMIDIAPMGKKTKRNIIESLFFNPWIGVTNASEAETFSIRIDVLRERGGIVYKLLYNDIGIQLKIPKNRLPH